MRPCGSEYVPGCLFLKEARATTRNYESASISSKPYTLALEHVVTCSMQCEFGTPSLGSVGHSSGLCSPCDFVHRGGCRAGMECKFCHLCSLSETRRYKKQRKGSGRSMRQ